MATAIVVMELCNKRDINPETTFIFVPKRAQYCNGTSANLKEGQKISILMCLYGLMLPSGNDAAITLANYFGKLLFEDYRFKRRIKNIDINLYVDFFILEMNRMAKKNLLKDTIFSNPHGLSDKGNRSTAKDLCILTYNYMKNPVLKVIFQTTEFIPQIYETDPENGKQENS